MTRSLSLSESGRPRFNAIPLLIGAVVLAFGLLASWLGAPILTLVVAVLGVVAAYELIDALKARLSISSTLVVYAACGLFPVVALVRSEAALLITTAISVVALAATSVFVGPRSGTTRALSLGVTTILYVGGLSSYLILIRTLEVGASAGPVRSHPGVRLLIVLSLMILAYRASFEVTRSRISSRSIATDLPAASAITWGGFFSGLIGAILAAVASSVLLSQIFGIATMILLASVVALGCLMSDLAIALITANQETSRSRARMRPQILPKLAPFLIAAPALFYAFRLYLT